MGKLHWRSPRQKHKQGNGCSTTTEAKGSTGTCTQAQNPRGKQTGRLTGRQTPPIIGSEPILGKRKGPYTRAKNQASSLLPHFLPTRTSIDPLSSPPQFTMSSRWDAAPQQQAGASTSASGSGSGSPPAASNNDPAAAAAAAAARIAASYGVGSSTAPSSQALTTLKSQSNGGPPTDKRREGNEAPFNEFVDVSMPYSCTAAGPSIDGHQQRVHA